jgi:hypothetical protein
MIDKWILEDINAGLSQRKRMVLLDPNGLSDFLLPILEKNQIKILQTNKQNNYEWQKVKEELFLRYEAENSFKNDNVLFYVTRQKSELSFLFDYCFTHGCIDLSNPSDWIRKKLFDSTGIQIKMDGSELLTAAKLSIDKDIAWWKRILQNLEDLLEVDEVLIPFLSSPEKHFNDLAPDVRKLFEEKLFQLIGQPYRNIPADSLANEVVNFLFNQLLNNSVSDQMLSVYHKWADSNVYSKALDEYVEKFNVSSDINIWNVHPDHCFSSIDVRQLKDICSNYRNRGFVNDKLKILKPRINQSNIKKYVPGWWSDIVKISEFENNGLSACINLDQLVNFYTSKFYSLDRAIRNIYSEFINEVEIVRPLQEHYESLNHELLQHWFEFSGQFNSNQQGYLTDLIAKSDPGIAVIVGDGVRYEIGAYIADQLKNKSKATLGYMLADMPSETEHNMSALYVGESKVLPVHKDRESALVSKSGKAITFMNLESLHYGIKAEYLVLTYKDIDSAGEKLQLGALKLFSEFENVLIEKIQLLLKIGYREVHLITDHGFVLTGLLSESDKIEVNIEGKKDIGERFIRTELKQNNSDLIGFNSAYQDFNYVYAAKSHRPFKSKGVYGYSHGGFTPQEIIIPNFVFRKELQSSKGLGVSILNKSSLNDVTGNLFVIKISAEQNNNDLFSANRKVQVILYSENIPLSTSNIFEIESGRTSSLEFSFSNKSEILAVLVDANNQEQLDSVTIKKSNARDLGGLL